MMTKEFVTAVVDAVVSMALYFGAKYLTPAIFEDVKFVIAIMQPIVLAIILNFVKEDAARYIQSVICSLRGRACQ